MRLIDADKIHYKDMSDGQVPDGVWYCFLEDIRKQTTVNAIPIEWIEELSAKLKEEDNFEKAMFLLDMIDVWSEENGNKGRNQNVL